MHRRSRRDPCAASAPHRIVRSEAGLRIFGSTEGVVLLVGVTDVAVLDPTRPDDGGLLGGAPELHG